MTIEHALDRDGVISTDSSVQLAESFIEASQLRLEHGSEGFRADLNNEAAVEQLRVGMGRLPRDLFRAWHRKERTGQVVAALGGIFLIVGFVEFKVRGGQDALKFVDLLHKAKAKFIDDKKNNATKA